MNRPNNNCGSKGNSISTSEDNAHSESSSNEVPSNDGSTSFGTSPATSGNPDGKTRLFSDKQRQDLGSEISNETGAAQNYRVSSPRCTALGSSVPRTLPGDQYKRETSPDIKGWLQTLHYRDSRKSKTQDVRQVTNYKDSTQLGPKVKSKQNPADISVGEFLQSKEKSQASEASRASQAPPKPKSSEDHTEDPKDSPCS